MDNDSRLGSTVKRTKFYENLMRMYLEYDTCDRCGAVAKMPCKRDSFATKKVVSNKPCGIRKKLNVPDNDG